MCSASLYKCCTLLHMCYIKLHTWDDFWLRYDTLVESLQNPLTTLRETARVRMEYLNILNSKSITFKAGE